jgi:sterol desaturase/sphingolipid hydroxylase (fatty acid hydroxylase superfamily)
VQFSRFGARGVSLRAVGALLWPLLLIAMLGLVAWRLPAVRYPLGLASAVLLAELIAVGWRESSLRDVLRFRDPSVRRDVLYSLATYAGVFVIGFGWLAGWFYGTDFGREIWQAQLDLKFWFFDWHLSQTLPFAARYLINLLILDITGTLLHYAQHHTRALWWSHEYHHSATSFTVFTSHRTHPLEPILQAWAAAIPMMILGSELRDVFLVSLFFQVYGLFLHSRVEWSYGWVGRWVLFNPGHHRAHHKLHGIGGNYGTIFVWWDMLLGTFEAPAPKSLPLGVVETRYNRLPIPVEPLAFMADFAGWVRAEVRRYRARG